MTALTQSIALASESGVPRTAPSKTADRLFKGAAYGSALLVLLVLAGILGSIIYGAMPAFREFGFGFLTSSAWNIGTEQFGALPAVIGTVAAALLALVIGVPVSLGIAIYLTQLCPGWARKPVAMTIELLASVPSIIYGMWGLFVFAPLFARFVQVPVSNLVEGSRSSARSSTRAFPPASACSPPASSSRS